MIDYSKYTAKELEESLRSIDSERFPENYKSLISEIEKRERLFPNEGEIESSDFLLEMSDVEKTIGVLQLIASVVIFGLALLSFFSTSFSLISTGFLFIFAVFNGVAGFLLFKSLPKFYWLSLLNQLLQIPSFAMGSVIFNYSGLGGAYVVLGWGEDVSFSVNASLSPGLSFVSLGSSLSGGYISIDVIAIAFCVGIIWLMRQAANKSLKPLRSDKLKRAA